MEPIVKIVFGLFEMRKAGLLKSIWCDAGRLRVVYPLPHDDVQVRIHWGAAEALVEAFYREKATAQAIPTRPPAMEDFYPEGFAFERVPARRPVRAEVAGKKRGKKAREL